MAERNKQHLPPDDNKHLFPFIGVHVVKNIPGTLTQYKFFEYGMGALFEKETYTT